MEINVFLPCCWLRLRLCHLEQQIFHGKRALDRAWIIEDWTGRVWQQTCTRLLPGMTSAGLGRRDGTPNLPGVPEEKR